MISRIRFARILASALLAAVACAGTAHANRIDEAGRALREPGVWVDADLSWLVSPTAARRLDRDIDRARVPVRVAVLPQIADDESRGDQRAIVAAIIKRVDRDGLYVLVDQDGAVAYAARELPLDLTEYAFPRGRGFDAVPLRESLAALVPTVRAARAAAPVSFLPYANPKGVTTSGDGSRTPLLVIALVTGLFGAALGVGLFFCVRVLAGLAGIWRQRA